jgi:NAD(P)-dependent dehydrogenase (short-subunit alcohol dehydrogenase family)
MVSFRVRILFADLKTAQTNMGVYMSFVANKTFILTGASSGIGRALAVKMAGLGAGLILNARREGLLEATADQCRDAGARVDLEPGDIADEHTVAALMAKTRRLGRLHGFIHAAGVLEPGHWIWEMTEEQYREVMDASVTGAWRLIRGCVPLMREEGSGLAVFFGSGAAEMVMPGLATYCVAKAAEEHMMRQLSAEAREIVTFAYRPHIVDTRMQQQAREASGGAASEVSKRFQAMKPNLISPEEAAQGLLDFMGDDPSGLHGKVVRYEP